MQRVSPLWLTILACAWFGIGGIYFVSRGFLQMVSEWQTFAAIDTNLKKRDVLFPGWAECVQVVLGKVPREADLVFLSDVDEERYGYLNYLLNYEIYPLRHLHRSSYRDGVRPRFVLIYLQPPTGLRFERYRKVHESPRVTLLEKQ